MKKRNLILALAGVMALTMGGAVFAGEKDYEDCELTFDWWGGDGRHEATLAALDAFMAKYPGIKVNATYGAWDGWEAAEALKFNSNTTADVVQINASWIPQYDAEGQTFLDLSTVSDTIDFSQWDQQYLDMCKDPVGG